MAGGIKHDIKKTRVEKVFECSKCSLWNCYTNELENTFGKRIIEKTIKK